MKRDPPVRLKPESRVAMGHQCHGKLYVIIVLRGRERIEYLVASHSLDSAATLLRKSRFMAEIRAAWPRELAEKLSLQTADITAYLLDCNDRIRGFLESLCSELPKVLGSKTDKG